MQYSQYFPSGFLLFMALIFVSFFGGFLKFSSILLTSFFFALIFYFTINFQSFYFHSQSNQTLSPRELKFYFLFIAYSFYFLLIGIIVCFLTAVAADLFLSLTLDQLLLQPLYLISVFLITVGICYFLFSFIYKYVSKSEITTEEMI